MAHIMCQCGKKIATIHVTEIINGEKKELHLCEDCAKEKKLLVASAPQVMDLSEVLGKIVAAASEADDDELNEAVCPDCGLSFREFRACGRFGCPRDYEVFRKGLEPLLERIHGTSEHRGKRPARPAAARRRDRLARLRAELEKAVAAEEYERAARIRDQIYSLKKELDDEAD